MSRNNRVFIKERYQARYLINISISISESSLVYLNHILGDFEKDIYNNTTASTKSTKSATSSSSEKLSNDRQENKESKESTHDCKFEDKEEENILSDSCKSFKDRQIQDALNHGVRKGLPRRTSKGLSQGTSKGLSHHHHKKEQKNKSKRNEKKKSYHNHKITRDDIADEMKYMDDSAREEFLFCMKALTGGFQNTGGFSTKQNTRVFSTGGQNEKSLYSNDIMSVHKKFLIGRYCRSNTSQLNTNDDVINENFLRNKERMLYV